MKSMRILRAIAAAAALGVLVGCMTQNSSQRPSSGGSGSPGSSSGGQQSGGGGSSGGSSGGGGTAGGGPSGGGSGSESGSDGGGSDSEFPSEGNQGGSSAPIPMPGEESDLEIRPFYEMEDFGEIATPEIIAKEKELRAAVEQGQRQ